VGVGKLDIDKQPIMVISPQSPIGQVIHEKQAGASVMFRDKEIKIIEIS
jgi:transcription elongation GreA/GreB family factor